MTDLETKIKDAFDEVSVPVEVKNQTLALIESQREHAGNQAFAPRSQQNPVANKQPRVEQNPATAKRPFWQTKALGFALAACVALAALGFGGWNVYFTETAYINRELNPSIEIGVNRFDRVISENALNNDGQEVLDSVSPEGKVLR